MSEKKSAKDNSKLKLLQLGTGWHIDCNGYNPYFEEQDSAGLKPVSELKFYRPIQALIALSSQEQDWNERDGGLDVIPGFHTVCEKYFKLQGRFKNGKEGPVLGRNLHRWGKYVTKFSSINEDILKSFIHVGRLPDEWDVGKLKEIGKDVIEGMKTKEDVSKYIEGLRKELDDLKPIQKGDYVLWDNKLPHRNSERNETNVIRRVMYHTLMPLQVSGTEKFLKEQRVRRDERVHPEMFEKTWQNVEKENSNHSISGFGKRLWGYEKFDEGEEYIEKRRKKIIDTMKLEKKYIDFYKRYGFVVIPNVLQDQEVDKLNKTVDKYIKENSDVDINNLSETLTSQRWKKITGSFGGMLNVFYLKEMEQIRSKFEFYSYISQILKETYSSGDTPLFEHPLGKFDETSLCLFPDRLNFRFPSSVLESLAKTENKVSLKRKSKNEEGEGQVTKKKKSLI